MSGGAFDYKQYCLNDLIDFMEELIVRVDKKPEPLFECNSLDGYVDAKESFKIIVQENIKNLKYSAVLTQRLNWFISGDDSEESMYLRLAEDLIKLEESYG